MSGICARSAAEFVVLSMDTKHLGSVTSGDLITARPYNIQLSVLHSAIIIYYYNSISHNKYHEDQEKNIPKCTSIM